MTTSSHRKLANEFDLFEFAPGKKGTWGTLQRMLPDVQTALFFGKAYDLDYHKLSDLVYTLFKSPLIDVLRKGNHSVDLQGYIVSVVPTDVMAELGSVATGDPVPQGEFLPELFKAAEITIATSIKSVTDKLALVLDTLPSKTGNMVFGHMAKLNKQRGSIGTYNAQIRHAQVPSSLVILDVSGSMTEETIRVIVDDVVAMSWEAEATLAIVSNTCHVWEPGTYNTKDILARAEYGGTRYETLAPLFDGRDWGTVITVADYDSSYSASQALSKMSGRIGEVIDISLVNRVTYLAECVGQLADKVTPVLIANSPYVLSN